MRKTKDIWHSPYNVYKHIDRLTKSIGKEAIEKSGKLKPVREARIASIAALAMYSITGKPSYIQLCEADPPDAYVMQQSKEIKGQLDISTLEITSYREGATESFLEQLSRTKAPKDYGKYSDEYILVVDFLRKETIDFNSTNEYLNKVNITFPVWVFRAISLYPDTIGELTIVNPKVYQTTINFGEAAFKMKSLGLPEVMFVKKATSMSQLNEQPTSSGIYNEPPWSRDIEKV